MKLVSINSIARSLEIDNRLVRGIAVGLGVDTVEVAGATVVSQEDAKRIERAYRSDREREAVASR